MIVSIDGNIGSGKSTLVKHLKEIFKDDNRFVFIQEPVNMWMENTDKKTGENILTKFYNNQEKYGFSFQIMAYATKLHILKEAIKNNPGKIIITERCVYTDKNVFAKMLYDESKIEDVCYNIYNFMFDEFLGNTTVNRYIYVKTDFKVCDRRIKKRERTGESSIPLEYLSKCEKYHKDWLSQCNHVLTLDGNNEFESNPEILDLWKQKILDFIQPIETKTQEMFSGLC